MIGQTAERIPAYEIPYVHEVPASDCGLQVEPAPLTLRDLDFELGGNFLYEQSSYEDPATVRTEEIDSAYPWLKSGIQRTALLGMLDDSWYDFEAPPPNALSVQLANRALRLLAEIDFEPSEIDATVDGGICISFYGAGRRANVEFLNTGEILAAEVKKGTSPFVFEINAEKLHDPLARLCGFVREE